MTTTNTTEYRGIDLTSDDIIASAQVAEGGGPLTGFVVMSNESDRYFVVAIYDTVLTEIESGEIVDELPYVADESGRDVIRAYRLALTSMLHHALAN